MTRSLQLNPDRFFDSDPTVRRIARELYESVRELPLVCPHGHVPPSLLAHDNRFEEPTSLLIRPDHYVIRMLYSQGVPLERLGIPTRDGAEVESDPRRIWQLFADHYHLFVGTPTRAWMDYVLFEVLGVRVQLDSESAGEVYEDISARLDSDDFKPRSLYDRFNVEVLTTTDAATDSLEHHIAIRDSGWAGRVIPCFRPDAFFKIAQSSWRDALRRLADIVGSEIAHFGDFVRALESRREFFKSVGATSTDHAVVTPYTEQLEPGEIELLFRRAMRGETDSDDQARFEAHMLMEMARMSVEDGLVMQIHPGSFRDHNSVVADRFGPDSGADIPVATEYTRNLRHLLTRYGNDPRLTLVVFTLDESTYARELAPLAGHYPAMRLGPPWWFHDSIEGITRYRQRTTETAGFYNTAGFNDDTRAFLSIPARHDLSRRVDANYLAGLVARHQIEKNEALRVMRALSYDLVRDTYKLG